MKSTTETMSGHALNARDLSGIRIAVASDSVHRRAQLQTTLERSGLRVVMSEPLSELFINKLEQKRAAVLILDIDSQVEREVDFLDHLLEVSPIPIIFNDVTDLPLNTPADRTASYGKLLRKLAELTGRTLEHIAVDPLTSHLSLSPLGDAGLARNVWVLGASLGGPQTVKRFLHALPANLPVAFVLAQHLGENFVSLLADQLDRSSSFQVTTPQVGYVLRHGQVVVAPVDERLVINPIGAIELNPCEETSSYRPSIDRVLKDVATRYGRASGAIIFTGMGDDGVAGCRAIAGAGGQVWVQEASSCVISAMPDAVIASGVASRQGAPEELAQALVEHFDSGATPGAAPGVA